MSFNALDSFIFVHVERHPDTLKHIALEKLDRARLDARETELVKSLEEHIHDSIEFRFEHFEYKHNLIVDGDEESKYFQEQGFFGSINLSNPVLNDSGTEACYYFALNCGPVCSAGFLVFVESKGGTWMFRRQVQVWREGTW